MGLKKCPCGSGKQYCTCCGPLLAGEKTAQTAEQLMRSRYTANVERNATYLLASWHPSTRPQELGSSFNDWQQLQVLETVAGELQDEQGGVEFRAVFRQGAMQGVLHEKSRFCKEGGRWYYIDGEILDSNLAEPKKVGRNNPCPCGSGRKYKKCCLK